jgi:hypothetical protein
MPIKAIIRVSSLQASKNTQKAAQIRKQQKPIKK